jgi:aspartate aminotransferase
MGLYGQRIGSLSVLCDSKEEKENVEGCLKGFARRMYSNPPLQGARVVKTILSNPELYNLWLEVFFFTIGYQSDV